MPCCVAHFIEPAVQITKVSRRGVAEGGISTGITAGSKVLWNMWSLEIESK